VPRFFGALTDSDKLPTKEVKLDELHAMQDRVDPVKVEAIGQHGARRQACDRSPAQRQALHCRWPPPADRRLARRQGHATVAFKDLEPVDQALKSAPKST
jgi:hypothetical protein